MISRDPAKLPVLTPELAELANRLGKTVVLVMLDPDGAKVDEPVGLSFIALVDHVPRVGEIIRTQDKKRCRVTDVYHGVVKVHDPVMDYFTMSVSVYAVSAPETE